MRKIFLITFIFFAVFSTTSLAIAEDVSSVTLRAEDGVDISCECYRRGSDSVIIVCPGYFNSKENRWMRKTVELFLPGYDVIIFDFRGHGKSGGKYTWSAKEHMDVNAVLDFAKAEGYEHIGIVAFSLGAASAVNAASERDDIDSMILVSCPSGFRMIDFHFWEPGMFSDLADNIKSGWQGKGARATHIFMPKTKPIDTISKIKAPVLFIHGEKDWVVKPRHSVKLHEAANAPKKLEIIKGGFHAERLVEFHEDRIRHLMLEWFSETFRGK